MRRLVPFLTALLLALPALAENPTPYPGTIVIRTGQPFAAFVERLRSSIDEHGMGIVAEACATCGAAKIGVTIPGNRVIMIYRPDFAVRMLEASEAAGIEAPLRLYVTENEDGSANLTYRQPSHVFAPYETPELDSIARELDGIVANVVATATDR